MNEKSPTSRLASVDVYRGFVMFLMMAEVLECCRVAEGLPNSWLWSFLCWHQSHVEWVGCSLHDMIQPSFSFLVGTAMVYSMKRRTEAGATFTKLFLKVLKRSLILVLLGIFLRSMGATQTYFTFEDTLTQIGLGYPFLFLISYLSVRWQWVWFGMLVVGYWLAFAVYPLPGAGFDFAAAGADPNWPHNLTGFAAHWNKNTNFAWAADRWFLNLFPRESTFQFNGGGYTTLSFIPTLATMLLGLFAGRMLQAEAAPMQRAKQFISWGAMGCAVAVLIHIIGLCPIVKRIWTPSWVLWSGGLCFLFMALFYWLVDIKNLRRPFFWLQVIGMNSIAAYVLAHTVILFIHSSMQTHFGQGYDAIFGEAYASLVRGGVMLLVQWWVLYWLWKRGVFIKV